MSGVKELLNHQFLNGLCNEYATFNPKAIINMLYIWVPVYLSIFLFKMRKAFIKSYLAHFILGKQMLIFSRIIL